MDSYFDLRAQIDDNIDCHVFDSVTSTNDYLESLEFSLRTQVCVANKQTQGKGQHNRVWLDGGNSVLLSILRTFPPNINLNGLSLVIGLAILEVLKDYEVDNLQLKWPNDIYYQGKKLAGILIKNIARGKIQSVIIGVGINIDVDIDCQAPWTDLYTISKKPINKFVLTKDLINKILQFGQTFEAQGFVYFSQQWKDLDYLYNKKVSYSDKNRTFSGVCCGVNDQGVLLVKTKASVELVHSSKFLQLL